MSQPADPTQKTFMGHPVGLFVLFFTEMWERFSYYGMRGLLKLYMVNYLFVTVRQVYQGKGYEAAGDPSHVFGWDTIQRFLPSTDLAGAAECISNKVAALTAGDPVKGLAPMLDSGVVQRIAEQTCSAGPKASVIYGWYTGLVYLTPLLGGWLADKYLGQRRSVFLGGGIMAAGQFLLFGDENLFFVGLLLLIVGNGFFKPNISTQVGALYPEGDPRRDGAFTIFYMGINLGAFLCNFVAGTLAMVYGWRYGFMASGIGMLIGLVVQFLGGKYLAPDSLELRRKAAAAAALDTTQPHKPERQPLTPEEWKRVWALVGLCLLNIIFWAVYEQQGNTMQSWADEQTIWPTWASSTWFQSINPFFIFLLAPVLDIIWRRQSAKGKEPSSVTKMVIGCFVLGLSFVVMIIGAKAIGDGKGSPMWLVACTLMLTIGELYLSPIGLSLVTKVSPTRIVSMMMGMWFMSSFFGNIMSGYIGQLYTTMSKEGFFFVLMVLGISAGLMMWAFNKPLKRAMASQPTT